MTKERYAKAMQEGKIPASDDALDEAWDKGELGCDEQYVGVCQEDAELEQSINDSLDLKPVEKLDITRWTKN